MLLHVELKALVIEVEHRGLMGSKDVWFRV